LPRGRIRGKNIFTTLVRQMVLLEVDRNFSFEKYRYKFKIDYRQIFTIAFVSVICSTLI
jgi:hypothetical protein